MKPGAMHGPIPGTGADIVVALGLGASSCPRPALRGVESEVPPLSDRAGGDAPERVWPTGFDVLHHRPELGRRDRLPLLLGELRRVGPGQGHGEGLVHLDHGHAGGVDAADDPALDLLDKKISELRLEAEEYYAVNPALRQYVQELEGGPESTFGRRYVFADVDQTTFSLETRVNWTFTPDLSLEIYAQPFVSSGDFENYKEFLTPREYEFGVYGQGYGTLEPAENGFRFFTGTAPRAGHTDRARRSLHARPQSPPAPATHPATH